MSCLFLSKKTKKVFLIIKKMSSSKNVSIVLVSYKSRNKILNFLKNISEHYKIIIIENSYDKVLKKEI